MSFTDAANTTTGRAAARAAAELAVAEWVFASYADAVLFADRIGVVGPDRLVMFDATLPSQHECGEELAELTRVTVAGPGLVCTLTMDSGSDPMLWAEAVSLWSDLRDANAASMSYEIPISLVLAIDDKIIAGYEPFHCDEHGPSPAVLAEVDEVDAPPTDPFAALLEDADAGWHELNDRLEYLYDTYGVVAPGEPAGYSCDDVLGPDHAED